MRRFPLPALLTVTLILTACSSSLQTPPQSAPISPPFSGGVSNVTPTPTDDPALIPTLFPNTSENTDMTRLDEQGAVVMEVTPFNLGTPADKIEFDIVMNTHSVDLGMDLAALSTLTTDTGVTVQADLWDAPLGGHHVEGKLTFPAMQDGKSILEGATKLTLTIVDVDIPSRVFEWKLK